MISFEKIIKEILAEQNIAGGAESAFGSGVVGTASQFSKDSYAPGDARVPKSLYGGIVTRKGLIKSRKKRKKKKR